LPPDECVNKTLTVMKGGRQAKPEIKVNGREAVARCDDDV
jgi:hypothetical protein